MVILLDGFQKKQGRCSYLFSKYQRSILGTEFTLSDINGRLIEVLNVNSHRTSLDVSGLEPGVYVLRSAKLNRSLQVVVQ